MLSTYVNLNSNFCEDDGIMKRELLIETAASLFYLKGVNEVGINEILIQSGVAKKTLYHHFKSKEDLIIATLHKRDQTFFFFLYERLSVGKNDREVLKALFSAIEDWFANKVEELSDFYGCYFINTSVGLARQSDAIKEYCKTHKQKVKQILKSHFTTLSNEFLDAIYLLIEGAIIIAFMTGSTDELRNTKKLTEQLLSTNQKLSTPH